MPLNPSDRRIYLPLLSPLRTQAGLAGAESICQSLSGVLEKLSTALMLRKGRHFGQRAVRRLWWIGLPRIALPGSDQIYCSLISKGRETGRLLLKCTAPPLFDA